VNDSQYPLVSIGIPTYNRADMFLRESIESALNQTYENIEVLVSDNASTDDTESVVKSFANSRIRYHRQDENIGANNNFNSCIELAKGDYFVLLPDDDLVDSDFVASCIETVHHHKDVGVVFSGMRVIDGDGKVLSENVNNGDNLSIADFFLGWFTKKFPLYLCSTFFHTESLKKIGGFKSKTNVYQDVVAESKIVANYEYATVPDVKASFRRHSVNFGGTPDRIRDWLVDSLYLLNIMGQLTPPERRSEVIGEGLRYFSWVNYGYADSLDSIPQRWKMYKETNKAFGCSYSPIKYFWMRELGRLRRAPGKLQQLIQTIQP
jgi:glycosyltransferase involved in cell wall biosynthesis